MFFGEYDSWKFLELNSKISEKIEDNDHLYVFFIIMISKIMIRERLVVSVAYITAALVDNPGFWAEYQS